MNNQTIEKKINPILSIVQKNRHQSAAQHFIRGTAPFMQGYIKQIKQIVHIGNVEKDLQNIIQLQQKKLIDKDQDKDQKKSKGSVLMLSILGGMLLGGALYLTKKFSDLNSQLQNINNGGEVDREWDVYVRGVDPSFKKEQFRNILVNAITLPITGMLEIIGGGFDALLNGQVETGTGKKENIFILLMRTVAEAQAQRVIDNNLFFSILKTFGISFKREVSARPRLDAYLRFGPEAMKAMGYTADKMQQSLTGNQYRYIYDSRVQIAGIGLSRREVMFVQMGSNWNFGKDEEIDYSKLSQRDREKLRLSGVYTPIDEQLWNEGGLRTSVAQFFKNTVERTTPLIVQFVTNSSLSGSVNRFTQGKERVIAAYQQMLRKNQDYKVLNQYTYRYGSIHRDTYGKGNMYENDAVGNMWEHYKSLYREIILFTFDEGLSRELRANHDELNNFSTDGWTVLQLALLFYTTSFIVVLKERLRRDKSLGDERTNYTNSNTPTSLHYLQSMLQNEYKTMTRMTQVEKLNELMITGALSAKQYFSRMKQIFQLWGSGKGMFFNEQLEILDTNDWGYFKITENLFRRAVNRFKHIKKHGVSPNVQYHEITQSQNMLHNYSESGESMTQKSIDIITYQKNRKRNLVNAYKDRTRLIKQFKETVKEISVYVGTGNDEIDYKKVQMIKLLHSDRCSARLKGAALIYYFNPTQQNYNNFINARKEFIRERMNESLQRFEHTSPIDLEDAWHVAD